MGAEFGRDRERESKRESKRERERESKRERQSTQRVIKAWIADELGQTPLGTGARHPVVYSNQRALDWRQRLECTHTWITCGCESKRENRENRENREKKGKGRGRVRAQSTDWSA
jgi:hypothetical protein